MKRLTPLLVLLLAVPVQARQDARAAFRKALDAWLDRRWDAPEPDALVKAARDAKLSIDDVEKILREGRAAYPEPPQMRGKLTPNVPLDLDHVDHATKYFIYVPTTYDPAKAHPLVLVGHGGSSARDLEFGARAALGGMVPFWTEAAEKRGYLLVAPLTDRGWGAIGNSILLSAISKVQREYHVDPDRVYVTGHSMGGHLSWRSGISMADRWGAVSPMSGGYDYVKDRQVYNLFNVPGYATWGVQEPYQINEFNRTIRDWMAERGYPWKNVECKGGHEIFPDQIGPVCDLFDKNPRDLYREKIYFRAGTRLRWDTPDKNPQWNKEHSWMPGRAIPCATMHWIRLSPLPDDPEDAKPEDRTVQEIWAERSGNSFAVASRKVRGLRIYLHPKMVDFSKPVKITVNGKVVFDRKVAPDLKRMLDLVREFDDRGRIFHAAVDVEVATDGEVPEPRYED